MGKEKEVISVDNLFFSYTKKEVLKNISLKIEQGDFVSIIGQNGSGKTTLLKLIFGFIKVSNSKIKLFGTAIEKFNNWDNVSYLKQTLKHKINTPFNVYEIVKMGLSNKQRKEEDFNKVIIENLNLVGMYNFKDQNFSTLSGGQKQRVLLAMTLSKNPKLLVLDEPASFLDYKLANDFFKIIEKINRDKNITILFVTHNANEVGRYSNKIVLLDKEIIFCGTPKEFCKSKKVGKHIGSFAQHITRP